MQFSPRTLVASIMVSLALAIPAAALAAPRHHTGSPTHHAAGTRKHHNADARKSAKAKAARKRRRAERAAKLRELARHAQMVKLQQRYEPYRGTVGGGGWPVYRARFAVPACIVNAESHGYLREHSHPYGSSGIYQIEVGTWEAFGGARYAHYPYQASLLDQSIVASRIWNSGRGASNWSTASGCGY
jgi:Transglycosylase-like domain